MRTYDNGSHFLSKLCDNYKICSGTIKKKWILIFFDVNEAIKLLQLEHYEV